jgi:hypothetical protein
MGGKFVQRVCMKYCVKLGKSATETLEMLHEAFGEKLFKMGSGF